MMNSMQASTDSVHIQAHDTVLRAIDLFQKMVLHNQFFHIKCILLFVAYYSIIELEATDIMFENDDSCMVSFWIQVKYYGARLLPYFEGLFL